MKDLALIEMLFSFGVVLALAIWELWRTPRPDEPEKESVSAKEPAEEKETRT